VTTVEHAVLLGLAFVVLFAAFSAVFEALKRVLFFLISRRRKVCGAYAEVYLREPGGVVVAPFVVLHDLQADELRVFGRAFVVDARGQVEPTSRASWSSTAITLSEVKNSTRELAYLFVGESSGVPNIHGTSRVGVPAVAWGDASARRGYFIDTDISEPAFGATGNKPFGTVTELDKHVDAVRFYSIKFDKPSYAALVDSCDGAFDRPLLLLRLFGEPSETAFLRFLETAGLKFLAEHTPTTGVYAEISRILKIAAGMAPRSGQPVAASAPGPVPVVEPGPASGNEQLEGSG
jgi:hypothetical protein